MSIHGRPKGQRAAESGYTIIELLVSMGIMMAVTGGIFSLMNPATGTFSLQPEVEDVQQRMRVGSDRIQSDLQKGGAGIYAAGMFKYWGAALTNGGMNTAGAGSLKFFMPAVFPRRINVDRTLQDASTVVRSDMISIVGVPPSRTQAMIWFGSGMLTTSDNFTVAYGSGCPLNDPICGIKQNERMMIYDDNANWDLFTVAGVPTDNGQPNNYMRTGTVGHTPAQTTWPYFQQSLMTEVRVNTYYLDSVNHKLMHSDGFSPTGADDVVLDDVVSLKFDYFGEAAPPQLNLEPTIYGWFPVANGNNKVTTWTSYGPVPPQHGQTGWGCFLLNVVPGPNCQQNVPTPFYWPAGTNCVFELDAQNRHVPRTHLVDGISPDPSGGMVTLPGGGDMVPLNPAKFNDGPWCPDPNSANRYDADLLRIRKVRVTMRVQAGLASLRGPQGPLFRIGGTAVAPRWVPDQEIVFDVTPRNLNFGR